MRILLPVDGSEHCRNALRFIASRQALSPEKEATVELLNVQHSIPEAVINALGLDSVRKASQDEGMKVIDAMREDAGDLDVRAKVEGGEFAPVIVREADHMDADLIVMGCRGLSAMEGFFVGSVSAKVISLTKRPLLLVRDKIPAGAMRVGICVDHSDYAHAAAEFVVNQREFFGKDAVFEVINVSETEETFHQAVEPVMTVFEDAGVPAERVHLKGKVGDAIWRRQARHARHRLPRLRQLPGRLHGLHRHAHHRRLRSAPARPQGLKDLCAPESRRAQHLKANVPAPSGEPALFCLIRTKRPAALSRLYSALRMPASYSACPVKKICLPPSVERAKIPASSDSASTLSSGCARTASSSIVVCLECGILKTSSQPLKSMELRLTTRCSKTPESLRSRSVFPIPMSWQGSPFFGRQPPCPQTVPSSWRVTQTPLCQAF